MGMREALDIQQAMDRFGDDVWRACMLYLSPSDAEDVFQETFVKYAFHNRGFVTRGMRKRGSCALR